VKILVLGASGQLGQCLKKVAKIREIEFLYFPDEIHANILDFELLNNLFKEQSPSFVINCAAYTAVDKAEDDIETCRKINRDGVSNIAELCGIYNATLVHVSTDFVFEGNGNKLLTEDDLAEPINIYGVTKLEGEKEVKERLSNYFIIRTSWLYSEFGNNFVKSMLKLGQEREELNIIVDQIGTPTYAVDLAESILDIIAAGKSEYGVYHFSNEGITSWYDFAKGIFDISNTPVRVNPIPTSKYPTRAKRPTFSVMDKSKIKSVFGIRIPYWRHSLERCMKQLAINDDNA